MNVLTLGGIAYYFNILAITGIIYFLLAILYQRSKRVIINTAEQPYKPDNAMFKLIFKVSLFAIGWFLVREYGLIEHVSNGWEYLSAFFEWTSDIISGIYHG